MKIASVSLIICLSLSTSVGIAKAKKAENILLHQRDNGGWPKNYDWERERSTAEKKKLADIKTAGDTTFDNGATHNEVRYLAKAFKETGDPRYKEACLKGIEFMLKAQYANGGWPQQFPKPSGYSVHITFNDGAMIGVMSTLREIFRDRKAYPFVSDELRERCGKAVEQGILCILKCQIVVDGKKTAWCAQHDEKTLAPRGARSYELPSISGAESVGVVRFLMEIDEPSREIIAAVQGAVRWFNEAKLTGIREIRKETKGTPKGWDKVVVKDASAPTIWARFYAIGTNRPIYCSRDGIPRKTLAEISYERRNGYSWLGYYAEDLLAKAYPVWRQKWVTNVNSLAPQMFSITEPVMFNTVKADEICSALQVFPRDNPWNQIVEDWPLHKNSRQIISSIGASKPLRYNPDMAFILIPPNQKRVNLTKVHYAGESDKGPFPIPETTPIEGWPIHYKRPDGRMIHTLDEVQRDRFNKGGDRHAIVVDPVNRMLYEFFAVKKTDAGWEAGQASVFDLKTNKLRPADWTSADAAGLPIFPAVVRYDELKRGIVRHAMRVTVRRTQRAYVSPARHFASQLTDPNLPRMGERIRLKQKVDVSSFPPEVQAILKGLKKYGMLVADNGIEWAISVTPDERIPVLHEELRRIKGSDFEVVVRPR
jgi:PelA/Pel-15E family pectate lyase